MAQYKSKPKTVEAVQWHPGVQHPGVMVDKELSETNQRPYVVTIHEQRAWLNDGDWIVQEPDGVHYYPVKDAVFKASYEPA